MATYDVNAIINNIVQRALRRQGVSNQLPINISTPQVPDVTVTPRDVAEFTYGKATPYLVWGSMLAPVISGLIASIQARKAGLNPYTVSAQAMAGMSQPTQALTQTIMQKMAELQKQKMIADALRQKAEEDEKQFQRELQKLQEQFKLQKQLLQEEYKLKQPKTQAEIERIKSQAESYKALAESRRRNPQLTTTIQKNALNNVSKLIDDLRQWVDLARKLSQNPNDPRLRAAMSGIAQKYGIDVNQASPKELMDLVNAQIQYLVDAINTYAPQAGLKPFEAPTPTNTASDTLPSTVEGLASWLSGGNK